MRATTGLIHTKTVELKQFCEDTRTNIGKDYKNIVSLLNHVTLKIDIRGITQVEMK